MKVATGKCTIPQISTNQLFNNIEKFHGCAKTTITNCKKKTSSDSKFINKIMKNKTPGEIARSRVYVYFSGISNLNKKKWITQQ